MLFVVYVSKHPCEHAPIHIHALIHVHALIHIHALIHREIQVLIDYVEYSHTHTHTHTHIDN